MSQSQDTYQLYKTPNIATIGAYVSVAVAIFFGAYVMSMRSHMTRREIQHKKDLQEARSRVDRLTLKLMHVSNELHGTHGSPAPARETRPDRADGLSGDRIRSQSPAAAGDAELPAMPRERAEAVEPATTEAERSGEIVSGARVAEAADLTVSAEREPEQAHKPDREPVASMAMAAPDWKEDPELTLVVDDVPDGGASSSLLVSVPDMPELDVDLPSPAVSPVRDPAGLADASPLSGDRTGGSRIVPDTEAFLAEAEALEGEIIVFNPEKQLVMVNIGRNRGAEVGRRLTLWRGETYIGDVRVQRVFANMSACEIISALDQGVRVGDVARSSDAAPSP